MIKTQVQIPDELFNRAKQVAAAKEWSFAEIVRRGLEYMTTVNPAPPEPRESVAPARPASSGSVSRPAREVDRAVPRGLNPHAFL